MQIGYCGCAAQPLYKANYIHQEKCSKIIIDYKAVMKAAMTGISCNRLSEVDIGYNPIIIVLQYLQFIVTIVIFSLIVLVIITLQFYYHVPPFLLGSQSQNGTKRCSIFKPIVPHSISAHCSTSIPHS